VAAWPQMFTFAGPVAEAFPLIAQRTEKVRVVVRLASRYGEDVLPDQFRTYDVTIGGWSSWGTHVWQATHPVALRHRDDR